MRPFRLTKLMTGVALSAFVALLARPGVLADTVEPVQSETGNGAPICGSDDIAIAPQSSAIGEGPCPAHAIGAHGTARARAYLIATATPGYTMMRQGPERAIERLHPEFVNRLAAAIAEARAAGLPFAGIFSAYRPPAFGVGGFAVNSIRSILMGSPSTSPGSVRPARRPLCSGTRSPRGTA
jgi:hypothetical protein